MNYGLILFCTFLFFLPKQLTTIMNLNESYRFLTAKDSENAKKAALLTTILMGIGSLSFSSRPGQRRFCTPKPPMPMANWAARLQIQCIPDVRTEFMPVGTVGLLVAGLFAATMSSMDSALNKTAGIFVRSVYQPLWPGIAARANDRSSCGLAES